MNANEVAELRERGYRSADHIEDNHQLREAIELIASGFFSPDDPDCFQSIVDDLWSRDPYMVCADFAAYVACQERVAEAYRTPDEWTRQVVHNLSGVGRFSSDRTISEYAREIWDVAPVPIELDRLETFSRP